MGSPFLLEPTYPSTSTYHHLDTTLLEGHYSPECMEGKFSEVPTSGLRSSEKFVAQPQALSRPLCVPCHYARDLVPGGATLSIEENPVARTGSSTGVPSLDEEQGTVVDQDAQAQEDRRAALLSQVGRGL